MNVTSILVPIFVILGLIVVIAGVVFLITRSRQGKPFSLSLRFILLAYFYLICLISIVIVVSGLVSLVNAGLSGPLGTGFSYQSPGPVGRIPALPPPGVDGGPQKVPPPTPTPEQLQQELQQQQQQVNSQRQDDIINGSSKIVIAGLIWFFHWLGRRSMKKTPTPGELFLSQAYLIIPLLIFGIVSIVSLPTAAYQAIRYYVYTPQPYDYIQAPGNALATAISFVPFWIYYLKATIKELSSAHKTAPEGE